MCPQQDYEIPEPVEVTTVTYSIPLPTALPSIVIIIITLLRFIDNLWREVISPTNADPSRGLDRLFCSRPLSHLRFTLSPVVDLSWSILFHMGFSLAMYRLSIGQQGPGRKSKQTRVLGPVRNQEKGLFLKTCQSGPLPHSAVDKTQGLTPNERILGAAPLLCNWLKTGNI